MTRDSGDSGTAAALVLRGAVFGLCARLLGPVADSYSLEGDLAALRTALDRLGEQRALDALDALAAVEVHDHDVLRTRWTRLFELGGASPYEMSYLRPGLGGNTARLADVSGFYRAFGFRVGDERPDHVVAELEFAAFLAFGEAHARETGDTNGTAVFEHAMESFLGDHLGGWLDLLAERVEQSDPESHFAGVLRAAAAVVDEEAARRGVEVVRPERVDVDPFDDDEEPACASCEMLPAGDGPPLPR